MNVHNTKSSKKTSKIERIYTLRLDPDKSAMRIFRPVLNFSMIGFLLWASNMTGSVAFEIFCAFLGFIFIFLHAAHTLGLMEKRYFDTKEELILHLKEDNK